MNYGRVRVSDVIGVACRLYGIDEAALTGAARHRPLVQQRQAAMEACHQLGFSSVAVSAAFCRDHSTVLHAYRRAAADPLMMQDAEAIVAALA